MNAAIQLKKVRKTYGKKIKAVQDLSLTIAEGSIYALLGPNGSGKSTTFRILTTLASADQGEIHYFGSPKINKQMIGCVAQNSGVDPTATGRENLMLQGRIYGLPKKALKERVNELLTVFHLQEAADRLSKHYSGGMKRKLDLAMGIIHRPKLLFLDEPTTGLDPESRAELWQMIKQLQSDAGMTVLLTTHYMEEADELADRIAFMNEGRIVAEGTPDEMKNKVGGDTITIECREAQVAAQVLAAAYSVQQPEQQDESTLHVVTENGAEKLPNVIRLLEEQHIPVDSIKVSRPDIGDAYLLYTGKTLRKDETS
ncbi:MULTISPECIES: ABC transporter ATP-binding protein [Shouchella]|uniref:ABC transporter ATP-binding protein n=1 Tax=Shouchella TaxID=2893057 RepID=UPI0009128A2B|nr:MULTISPECIES: ABC transporter ATP-binding protein [Shouchella]MBX0321335.1 ABC transporter ATP-binding protein [Shouchella clausii]MDO7282626.1 ABC transporter ATP-binding protein [Shouchella clausii]MDO7302723.1 ABC transporter ATP-binding protein [Shouchella clausii]PAE94016.1 ABC transporter ATP-binding protein [Shouchella clausii]SHK93939.1 ABC-2 type transport system ATP-binding protein [Shouchella rhizosphaerae]